MVRRHQLLDVDVAHHLLDNFVSVAAVLRVRIAQRTKQRRQVLVVRELAKKRVRVRVRVWATRADGDRYALTMNAYAVHRVVVTLQELEEEFENVVGGLAVAVRHPGQCLRDALHRTVSEARKGMTVYASARGGLGALMVRVKCVNTAVSGCDNWYVE